MVARRTLPALALCCAVAQADAIFLKDGTVLEGTVSREGKELHVEGIEGSRTLPESLVERIVPTDGRVRRARELISGRRLLAALNACSGLIEERPDDIEGLRTRAEVYLRMGLAPKAAADLQRAVEAGSRSVPTLRLLEEACWKARKPDRLVELLRAALEERPSDSSTRARLVAALRAGHRYQEAMDCAREGLDLEPYNLSLAFVREEMRARVEAAPAIRKFRTSHYAVMSWADLRETQLFAAELERAYGVYASFFASGSKGTHVARFFPTRDIFERWRRAAYDRGPILERARLSMRDAAAARALELLDPFRGEIWEGAARKWLSGSPDPENAFRAVAMIDGIGKAREAGEKGRAEALMFELLKLAASPGAEEAPQAGSRATPPAPPGGGPIAMGFYVPPDRELILWNSKQMLHRVVKHEALHQFLDSEVYGPPIWFNEGLATFFECSQRGEFALNPDRLRSLAQAISRNELVSLKELFLMEHAEFNERSVVLARYAQAWSVVAFLCRIKNPNYLRSYFQALKKGLRKEDAFEEVFARDCDRLEGMWKEWTRELVRRHGGAN